MTRALPLMRGEGRRVSSDAPERGGCRYFIRKPYDPNALLTLIRQAIDEAEAA